MNQHKIVHKVQPVHKEIPLNQTETRLHYFRPIWKKKWTSAWTSISNQSEKHNPTSVRLNTISLRVVNQQYQFLIIIMLWYTQNIEYILGQLFLISYPLSLHGVTFNNSISSNEGDGEMEEGNSYWRKRVEVHTNKEWSLVEMEGFITKMKEWRIERDMIGKLVLWLLPDPKHNGSFETKFIDGSKL